MKKTFVLAVMMLMLMGVTIEAEAGLETIGTATYGGLDYDLIYDNDLQLTWLDYNSGIFNTWDSQMNWASGLNAGGVLTYDFNAGVGMNWTDNWRLPTTTQPDPSCSSQYDPGDGSPIVGYDYNCTGSEMGHLYYTELGNPAGGPALSNNYQILFPGNFWSSTEYVGIPNSAYIFSAANGKQNSNSKNVSNYAVAVRSGQIAVVPEPISSTLFIVGAAALGFRRFRKTITN